MDIPLCFFTRLIPFVSLPDWLIPSFTTFFFYHPPVQNTRWFLEHPFFRLGNCFHTRTSHECRRDYTSESDRKRRFPQCPRAHAQSHSRTDSLKLFFALFIVCVSFTFWLLMLFCCGLDHRNAGFVDARRKISCPASSVTPRAHLFAGTFAAATQCTRALG